MTTEYLKVPAGMYRIGTTAEGVHQCVEAWKGRLINPCYSETAFREWIEKEFPAYTVTTPEFDLRQTLVTNQEAREFLRDRSLDIPESILLNEGDIHPVWGVSLSWAQEFAVWLSEKDPSYHYRLPTETEWEIAARGSDFREYPYGDEFDAGKANTVESGIGTTTPVDRYDHAPGPFGHLDLAGNVEEWVSTKYHIYPGGHVIKDDLFERFGMNYSILRGGSFVCGGDLSRGARRHGPFPDPKFRYTGFRLVRCQALFLDAKR